MLRMWLCYTDDMLDNQGGQTTTGHDLPRQVPTSFPSQSKKPLSATNTLATLALCGASSATAQKVISTACDKRRHSATSS
jgi:hypothetical protein